MSIENPVRARGGAAAATRVALTGALVLAIVWTATAAVGSAAALVVPIATGRISAALFNGTPLPDSLVHDHLVEGTWRQADVTLRDVPGGIVAFGVSADAAGMVARLALGAALVLLLLAVRRRAPFSAASATTTIVFGGAAAIGALLQIGLGVLRDWMLADLLTRSGSGTWPMRSMFDPTLLVVGFGVMVVGLLLSHAAMLQRETDGLV